MKLNDTEKKVLFKDLTLHKLVFKMLIYISKLKFTLKKHMVKVISVSQQTGLE